MNKVDEEKSKKLLELRKVKALEKIGESLEALTVWFEETDRKGWDKRAQYYLSEFLKIVKNGKE